MRMGPALMIPEVRCGTRRRPLPQRAPEIPLLAVDESKARLAAKRMGCREIRQEASHKTLLHPDGGSYTW